MNKAELLAKLTDELMSDIETGVVGLEKIILRASKIARLDGDTTAHKWLRLELSGYNEEVRPQDISADEGEKLAHRSNRYRKQKDDEGKDKWMYYFESVSAIESNIESSKAELQAITTPTHVTPVTQGYMHENFSTVLQKVRQHQSEVKKYIKDQQNLLSNIRSGVYDYAYEMYSRYTFEAVADTIFTQLKAEVDARLQLIAPGTLQQFTSAYNRLRDGDGEDLSQALSTCRNILKAFADYVQPATEEKEYITSDGKTLKITNEQYKNRIIKFLDTNSANSTKDKLNKARAIDLTGRLVHLQSLLSKGAKNKIMKGEAQKYVIETYLLLADLIEYIPKIEVAPTKKKLEAKAKKDSKVSKGIDTQIK